MFEDAQDPLNISFEKGSNVFNRDEKYAFGKPAWTDHTYQVSAVTTL